MSLMISSSRLPAKSFNASRMLGLRHSGLTANMASFDRYAAIRSFFTRPHVAATPYSVQESKRKLQRFDTSSYHLFSRFPRPINLSIFSRNFHATPCRPHQNSQPKSRVPETPSASASIPIEPADKPQSMVDLGQPPNYDNYPRFFRRLAQSLPHVPSRPTRDDFLSAANGFSQRMRVRFRWFFIRAFRKFNADDISAFITWFIVGQGLWILVGT